MSDSQWDSKVNDLAKRSDDMINAFRQKDEDIAESRFKRVKSDGKEMITILKKLTKRKHDSITPSPTPSSPSDSSESAANNSFHALYSEEDASVASIQYSPAKRRRGQKNHQPRPRGRSHSGYQMTNSVW